MAKQRKQRADHRADTRGGALSGLPHAVSDSAAYLALPAFERAVLGEILRTFNGYNNGDIALTYERIRGRIPNCYGKPTDNRRIGAAVARLVEHGFLGEPTPGDWLKQRARRYRLTFISSGARPPFQHATNDYLRWTPKAGKNEGDTTSPRKPRCGDTASPKPPQAGDTTSPKQFNAQSEAAQQPPANLGDVRSLVICKPSPVPCLQSNSTPSQPNGPAGALRCEKCGDPFTPADRGKPKRFCSEKCRKAEEARRRHERQKAAA